MATQEQDARVCGQCGEAVTPAAIVFAGSGAVSPAVRAQLPGEAYVLAADSGLGVAQGLGVQRVEAAVARGVDARTLGGGENRTDGDHAPVR